MRQAILTAVFAVSSLLAATPISRAQNQTSAKANKGSATAGSVSNSALTPDGQPDIQGFWVARPGGDTYDLEGRGARPDYLLQGNSKTPRPPARRIVDPADGRIPYQPWAAAKAKNIRDNVDNPTKPEDIDTQARCLIEGPGRIFIHSGFQVLQTPGRVVFLSEANDEYRVVPIGDQPHINSNIQLWEGDPRGRWEGNTLVIDITNLKAKSRLDMVGDFYSPNAHFVERFTRVDNKTINYEATVTDPTVYTRPWTFTIHFVREHTDDPTYEQWEYACHEGERSSSLMVIPPDVAKENAERAAKAAKH